MVKTLNDYYETFQPQVNILSSLIPDSVVPSAHKPYVDIFIRNRYSNRKLSYYAVGLSYMEFTDMYMALSFVINDKFGEKWSKLISLNNLEYNPLKPFNIELSERVTDNFKTVKDVTSSSGKDETYAFNSAEPTPTDESKGETIKEYERENPRTREYTRVGNIGNTSMQDLIKQEREVVNWVILDVIIEDIISVVCRKSYALQ